MLTNILIAKPEEATAIGQSSTQSATWPCLELNGLDNAKMAALLGALGFPKQAMELEGEQHLAVTVSEGGPWVFHLPQELRDALAAMPPSHVVGVAERWVSHEELAYDGWSATDVVPLLEMLQQLASNAASEQKALLLWMSL